MAQPLALRPPAMPPSTVERAGDDWKRPPAKGQPTQIGPHMHGLRTDADFDAYMQHNKGATILLQFGSTWCVKCAEFFPTFYSLSKQYGRLRYAVAQVDYMRERARGIRFSPTFSFFRDGRRVDQVVGKDAQKLEDHLWLHNDRDVPLAQALDDRRWLHRDE